MTDRHNNIGRFCTVTGVPGRRVWRLVSEVVDRQGRLHYWLENYETDAKMRCNVEAMTELY